MDSDIAKPCNSPVFDRLNTPGGLSPVQGPLGRAFFPLEEKLLHLQDTSHV